MQFSMTFPLELEFDFVPAEYERGHLFQPERMALSDSNLELSDTQIALFEEKALKEFKAKKADAIASKGYDIYLDNLERTRWKQ